MTPVFPIPVYTDRTNPDTSFGQDMRAIAERVERARRWRRRRRLLMLRRLMTGRMPWRLPTPLGRPHPGRAPAPAQ